MSSVHFQTTPAPSVKRQQSKVESLLSYLPVTGYIKYMWSGFKLQSIHSGCREKLSELNKYMEVTLNNRSTYMLKSAYDKVRALVNKIKQENVQNRPINLSERHVVVDDADSSTSEIFLTHEQYTQKMQELYDNLQDFKKSDLQAIKQLLVSNVVTVAGTVIIVFTEIFPTPKMLLPGVLGFCGSSSFIAMTQYCLKYVRSDSGAN